MESLSPSFFQDTPDYVSTLSGSLSPSDFGADCLGNWLFSGSPDCLETADIVETCASPTLFGSSSLTLFDEHYGRKRGRSAVEVVDIPAIPLLIHPTPSKVSKSSSQKTRASKIYREERRAFKWSEESRALLKERVRICNFPSVPPHITGGSPLSWNKLSMKKEYPLLANRVIRERWFGVESDKIDRGISLINDREMTYLENNINLLKKMGTIWVAISKLLYELNGRDKYIPTNTLKNLFNQASYNTGSRITPLSERMVVLKNKLQ